MIDLSARNLLKKWGLQASKTQAAKPSKDLQLYPEKPVAQVRSMQTRTLAAGCAGINRRVGVLPHNILRKNAHSHLAK
eukprot:scaffold55030_cov17-Tisochrysis_lutea.AAC.3